MKPWGLAATFGFAILAFGIGQAVGVGALFAIKTVDLLNADKDGTAVAILTLVANPFQVVTLVLAARLAGADALEYLALNRPRWRAVGIAVIILIAAIALADLVTYLVGKPIVPPFQTDIYRSSEADGTLIWLWLAVVVVAPIGEELLFRGFMFRGFVREPRDSLPAILVISLLWALLHLGQYDWFGVAVVFALGVLLGYVRYISGSTTLTIFLHMMFNLESVAETLIALRWP
jgi:membrane protease YdiL (CAAX protease family)